ncbi:hypothetical protein [uncultured Helicobacter sp.]|nr:hypothetical protein [uncultured Helicobacter sp.]
MQSTRYEVKATKHITHSQGVKSQMWGQKFHHNALQYFIVGL